MLAKVNSQVCLTTEEYVTEWKEGQYLVIAIVFTMAKECQKYVALAADAEQWGWKAKGWPAEISRRGFSGDVIHQDLGHQSRAQHQTIKEDASKTPTDKMEGRVLALCCSSSCFEMHDKCPKCRVLLHQDRTVAVAVAVAGLSEVMETLNGLEPC